MSQSVLSFILNALIALLPILGWIYFFQKKQPEKKAYVILTFLAGMVAVFPIKIYERYLNTAIWKFEHLNLFQSLANLSDIKTLPSFFAYISINMIVAAGIFLFVALLMFCLEIFSGDNSFTVFRKKCSNILESPLIFISVGILCGLVAYFASFSIHKSIWFFVIVGLLEEFVKHLVLRFSDEEKIRSVNDALEFSILVALGFAFVENILYFESTHYTGQIFSFFVLSRSTVSVAAHVCFSAIFGYFYGIAKFSSVIYQQEKQANKHPIIEWAHRILHCKASTLFHEETMMIGMLCAMGLHAVFNCLLEFGKTEFVLPFIALLMFITLHLFYRKNIFSNNGILLQPINS